MGKGRKGPFVGRRLLTTKPQKNRDGGTGGLHGDQEDRSLCSNSGGSGGGYLEMPLWQTSSETEAGTLLSLLLSKLAFGP